jgi:SAM-dependent methyltransferase
MPARHPRRRRSAGGASGGWLGRGDGHRLLEVLTFARWCAISLGGEERQDAMTKTIRAPETLDSRDVAPTLMGFKYRCPFCRSYLRAFLPFGSKSPALQDNHVIGGGYRDNALCPVCDSLDRERLLYLFLLWNTDVFDTAKRLLHVAPETRVADILFAQTHVDYLTADLHSREAMLTMDITDIRFPDSSFDAIICNHVLEHIIDDRKAMSELFRTLKPGGWAILQVPMSPSLEHTYEDASKTTPQAREEAFGQWDHVRIYAQDYEQRLAQADGAHFQMDY